MSNAASPTNGASPPEAAKAAAAVAGGERNVSIDEARQALVDAAAELIHARRQAAREIVRGRPATAIAAALGVGIIIGLLARR